MELAFFKNPLALVRGGGYWAGGLIYRLHRAGFGVIVTELETPRFVHRAVSYGEAIYSKWIRVNGLTSMKVDLDSVEWAFAHGRRPDDEEVFNFNEFMRKYGWNDEATDRLKFRKETSELGHRDDIVTMFQYIDADEGRG